MNLKIFSAHTLTVSLDMIYYHSLISIFVVLGAFASCEQPLSLGSSFSFISASRETSKHIALSVSHVRIVPARIR